MLNLKNWFYSQSDEANQDTNTDHQSDKDVESTSKDEKQPDHNQDDHQNDQITNDDDKDTTDKNPSTPFNWGSFIANVKNVTSDVASRTVTVASKLKDTVEEKTVIGSFMREQKQFIESKQANRIGEAAVPPWVGYNEEEAMKTRILALSKDRRNFLRSPPSGAEFRFDAAIYYPVAMVTLEEDGNLMNMRFELVPKLVKEEEFWRNYFYRVSLIKQSIQLSSMAEANTTGTPESTNKQSSLSESASDVDSVRDSPRDTATTPNTKVENNDSIQNSETENQDTSLQDQSLLTNEFVSEAYTNAELSHADLADEMHQLGILKKETNETNDTNENNSTDTKNVTEDESKEKVTTSEAEKLQDWEIELQKELEEYEVVNEMNEDHLVLEEEIEDMLELEGGST
ncbi:Synapse-associated protein 1 [Trichoplax sp. H2]|nr:Synapse-associated protein 1 [Trichoplax sp. H2]|eukprot:RDD45867.1 Synapse-associated protein 1 [Trichoplax sp. H2]